MSAVTPFQGGSSLPTRPLRAALLAFVAALALVEVGAGLVTGQAWRLQGAGELTAAERGDLQTLFDRLAGLETAVVAGVLATTLVWSLVVAHNALFAARTSRTVALTTAVGWVVGPILFLVVRAAATDGGESGVVGVLAQAAALYVPFWATGRLADSIGGQRMPFMRWYLALGASFLVHDFITSKVDLDPQSAYDDFGKGAFMLLLNAMVVGVMGVMAAEATRSMDRAVVERAAQHRMLVEDAHLRRRAHGQHTGDAPVLPSPPVRSTDGPRLPAPAPGSVKVAAAPVLAAGPMMTAAPVAVLAPPSTVPMAADATPSPVAALASPAAPAAFVAPPAAPVVAAPAAPSAAPAVVAPAPLAAPAPIPTAPAPLAAPARPVKGLPTLAASPWATASAAPAPADAGVSLGELVDRTPATDEDLLPVQHSVESVPVVSAAPPPAIAAPGPFDAPPAPMLVEIAEAVSEAMASTAAELLDTPAEVHTAPESPESPALPVSAPVAVTPTGDVPVPAAPVVPVVFESLQSPVSEPVSVTPTGDVPLPAAPVVPVVFASLEPTPLAVPDPATDVASAADVTAVFGAGPVVFESLEVGAVATPVAQVEPVSGAIAALVGKTPALDLDGSLYPPLASLTAMRHVVDSDRAAAAEAAARADEEARLAAEAARLAEEEEARKNVPQGFAPLTPLPPRQS